jgi:hypothetical protein
VGRGRLVASFAPGEDGAASREVPEGDLARGLRNPLWVLTVIIAVAASVVRTCAER